MKKIRNFVIATIIVCFTFLNGLPTVGAMYVGVAEGYAFYQAIVQAIKSHPPKDSTLENVDEVFKDELAGMEFETLGEKYTYLYEQGLKVDFGGCNIFSGNYLDELKYFPDGEACAGMNCHGVLDNIPLTKLYASVTNDGRVVTAGCYKGYKQEFWANPFRPYGKLTIDNSRPGITGTAYVFGVFDPTSATKCTDSVDGADFVLVGYWYDHSFGLNDWHTKVNKEGDKGCPNNFFLTENFKKSWDLFEDKARYIFTDDETPTYHENIWTGFFKQNGATVPIVATILNDNDGYEEMKACYENVAKNEIPSYTCSDIDSYASKLKQYQTECKSDSKSHYMRDYDEQIQSQFIQILANAIVNKIESCYMDKCNLSQTKKDAITSKLLTGGSGSKSVTDILGNLKINTENARNVLLCNSVSSLLSNDHSDVGLDTNWFWGAVNNKTETTREGACYVCNDNHELKYRWSDTKPTDKLCSIQTGVKKDACQDGKVILNCINFYTDIYEKAQKDNIITAEEKKCLVDNLAERLDTIASVLSEITDDFRDTIEHDLDESQELRHEAAQSYMFIIPGLADGGFGKKGQKCNEILKNNGIKIIKGAVNILRIAGAIIAIGNAMIALIPAVISKDADALKKAGRKLVTMSIVLAAIGILPTFVYIIGLIFGYDLSCIF